MTINSIFVKTVFTPLIKILESLSDTEKNGRVNDILFLTKLKKNHKSNY